MRLAKSAEIVNRAFYTARGGGYGFDLCIHLYICIFVWLFRST